MRRSHWKAMKVAKSITSLIKCKSILQNLKKLRAKRKFWKMNHLKNYKKKAVRKKKLNLKIKFQILKNRQKVIIVQMNLVKT